MNFLQLENLHYHRAQQPIVSGLNVTIEKGRFACLLGPSGCGKTTLLRLLAGLEKPQMGSIHLEDVLLSGQGCYVPPDQRQIGMVFQEASLFPHKTVAENIVFGLPHSADKKARLQELLQHIGLADRGNAYPHELSGGQQHRVALARALAPSPKLLLLDEPFAHLDPDLRQRLRRDTLRLTAREGVTCLLVTHDAAEAMQVADTILVMDAKGHIRQQGTPHDVYHHPIDRYTAQALGDINILPARREGDGISTPLGNVGAAPHLQGEICYAVRPHDIEIAQGGAIGVITHAQCVGAEDTLSVALNEGISLQLRLPYGHTYQVNEKIGLRIRTGCGIAIAKD